MKIMIANIVLLLNRSKNTKLVSKRNIRWIGTSWISWSVSIVGCSLCRK